MSSFFKVSDKVKKLSEEALKVCKQQFERIENITEYNQQKMLKAFSNAKISESHFTASTGYGYGDRGREALDEVYAYVFGAEGALVRHNFVSGTHALTVALFGVLRPNDTMLCVTGLPYDTLRGVIGLNGDSDGSLKDFGINYEQINLLEDGSVDYRSIKDRMKIPVKLVYIQRSRGYTLRPSLLIEDIEKIVKIVKSVSPETIVMVDNCYGEFVQTDEPISKGADLIVGSLIKNPGGGIAPTGGYIAGRRDLVEKCSYRLTTPATGGEVGATLGQNRELFMGAFHAPIVTGEALKTAVFASALFELLNFEVSPRFNEPRGDIIQVLKLKNENNLISFCQGIQSGSPIDSFVKPEPWDMPGYDCKVIMAAGGFTLGSSIELSADAPIKSPYAAFMQGSLDFYSGKLGVMLAATNLIEK